MSAASRLANADSRIAAPRPDPSDIGWQLGKNRAAVPGGISAVPLPISIEVAGQTWAPEDALPHQVSIGYSLAVEMAEATK